MWHWFPGFSQGIFVQALIFMDFITCNCSWNIFNKCYPVCEVALIRGGFIKLGVYYRGRSKERGRLLEDLLCHIEYDFQVTYETTGPVPKQSCSKKLNIVAFVLMINPKPVIACYFNNIVYLPCFIYFL